jgi:putative ATPase
LNTLEMAVGVAHSVDEKWDKKLSGKLIADVAGGRTHLYDKRGEEHYNLISALHKSMRGSDANASVYWLYRMLNAGEEPLYIARRLIRFASEDVGMGDPQALGVTLAARESYRTLGSPEGELALAQAVLYLACAKKDVRVYDASRRVRQCIEEQPDLPVPTHLRNAPTAMMKEMGYGRDYQYPPTSPEGARRQSYLPPELADRVWFSDEEPDEAS